MEVYKAIIEVMGELAKMGIAKDRKNQQQNFNFRGIDDVYNTIAPLLSKAQLCILPKVIERSVYERVTKNGTVLFYVTVVVEYSFISAKDGSVVTVITQGEAMDSGDKATNKAMSAAHKYACIQAFHIPTEGDNDADATTPEEVEETAKGIDSDFLDRMKKAKKALGETIYRKTLGEWGYMKANEVESRNDKDAILADFRAMVIKKTKEES